MRTVPLPTDGIKLEYTVLYGTMPTFTNVTNLDAPA
jgi:hypothetical protein